MSKYADYEDLGYNLFDDDGIFDEILRLREQVKILEIDLAEAKWDAERSRNALKTIYDNSLSCESCSASYLACMALEE
jgi:hypothetical protein